jgi:hypothetical protein
MNIINMTPHNVNLLDENNQEIICFPASGKLVRLAVKTVSVEIIGAQVPITRTVFGEPEGLLNEFEGTFYIVSQLVKSALPHRKDLLVPAEVQRDTKGNILGCRSLGI